MLLLECRRESGDFRALRERLHVLLPEAEARGDHRAVHWFVSRYGYFVHLLDDDPEQARSVLGTAKPRDELNVSALDALCAQAEIDLYLGDPNAFMRVERVWAQIARSRLLRAQAVRMRLLFVRARAALASGYALPHERPRLIVDAQRQAALLAREKADVGPVWARLINAGAQELSGNRVLAIARFGEAGLACADLGLAQYAAVARRRQGILLGTEEARGMVVRAERVLKEQGAVDPGRIAAVLLGY
jgi:hypothetical protein